MRFSERLKSLRKEKGYTLAEMAEKFNLSKTAFSNYENNYRKPNMDLIEELADFFSVSVDYLLGRTNIKNKLPEGIEPFDANDMVKVPIVGTVSCGLPLLAEENVIGYEWVRKKTVSGGTYFFLVAKGDSMIGARIHEKDLVLIRKQEDIENGEIGAVLITNGNSGDTEATLKRVYKSDGQLVLQAENPKYEPIIKTNGQVNILGKVVEVRFKFD